jgi:multiple sugar transport system ATP-binding protein
VNGASVPTPVTATLADCVLGVRPEDCRLSPPGEGGIAGAIYSNELVGDHALVTVSVGENTIAAKAPKDFSGEIGSPIAIAVKERSVFVFDAASGERVR